MTPVDDNDDDERIRLQFVLRSQFWSVHGMSRIDEDVTVKSELLQLLMAELKAIFRLTKSCSAFVLVMLACRGKVFVGVALKIKIFRRSINFFLFLQNCEVFSFTF
jgi:hypothetical protein